MINKNQNDHHLVIRELSESIIKAQAPLRILNAIKWSDDIKVDFLKNKGKSLPKVDQAYYQQVPLSFDPQQKLEEFFSIERQIQSKLGQFSGVGHIMERMCREYRLVVHMLDSRGTLDFGRRSQELYGSAQDSFYVNGPSLTDLAKNLSTTLANLSFSLSTKSDEKIYSSAKAVTFLKKRLRSYFYDLKDQIRVKVDDSIIADAAAGADVIKIRKNAKFSERDIRILEVHEGWVHLGSTHNGLSQPFCTFLSKGTPSATIYQEGLAVIMEIFSFSSHPDRIKKLTNRIIAIQMAEKGANFLEIYHFFLEQGFDPEQSYHQAQRVFRGSTPDGRPFTKDLSYSKGFILIYNYIRLSIAEGKALRVPLLFLGKINLEDIHIYEELLQDGTIIPPKYLPTHFQDLASLSCWMAYSLFLNKLDLETFYKDFKSIL